MNSTFFCSALHWPDQNAAYDNAVNENPANAEARLPGRIQKRTIGRFDKLWKPGRTLKISFWEGRAPAPQALRQAIFTAASKWLPYAYLEFELVDHHPDGDIKIAINHDGNNASLLGTDALLATEASMLIGSRPQDPHFEASVIHEFGHALGADHEHQHPYGKIPWDREKVYAYYATQNISPAEVEKQVLNKLDRAGLLIAPYDRTSIMHYPVPQELTEGDWSVERNLAISSKDKLFMRKAYPRPW